MNVKKIEIDTEQLQMIMLEEKYTDVQLSRSIGKSDSFIRKFMQKPYPLYEPLVMLMCEKLNCQIEDIEKVPKYVSQSNENSNYNCNDKMDKIIELLTEIRDMLK